MSRPRQSLGSAEEKSPEVLLLERVVSIVPEPVILLSASLEVLALNPASERLFSGTATVGRVVNELVTPSGLEFDGVPFSKALETLLKRSGQSTDAVKLLVRKKGSELERIAVLRSLADVGGQVAWVVCIEGAIARDDLIELRSKARESAHSLNNVVMTAVGNVSLARLFLTQPNEVKKHLDSAERNLLQVRDITRDLQIVAKKDIPLG